MGSIKGYSALLLAVVLLVLIWAVLSGNLFNWPALDSENIKVEKVADILIAFIAVALVIERAGQVFIKMVHGSEEAVIKGEKRRAAAKIKAVERVQAARMAFPGEMQKPAQYKTAMAQENVAMDLAINETDAAAKRDAVLEAKADKVALTVSLSLAVLVSLSGFHFMESIVGANVIEEMVKVAPPETVEASASSAMSTSAPDSVQSTPVSSSQLYLFRGMDMLLTSLLLAGGSTGLRELLKVIKGGLETDS